MFVLVSDVCYHGHSEITQLLNYTKLVQYLASVWYVVSLFFSFQSQESAFAVNPALTGCGGLFFSLPSAMWTGQVLTF